MRTRFAPSPTGKIHLGHALAAKVAWDLAGEEGEFLLRHEDIDGWRVREEFYQGIEQDLAWLGFHWMGKPLRQSSRTHFYNEALQTLKSRNLIYPCFCTRREIQEEWARMGAAPQGEGGPVYPRTCRDLSSAQVTAKLAAGVPHAWRLDSTRAAAFTGLLTFTDLRHGQEFVNPDLLGDVVLARKDIGPAYHLAVVVDDAFQEITHVTRGEDLLESTHVHRLLQSLLDLPEPLYLHHRLMADDAGKRLAKRNDALAISALRASGMSPDEVLKMIG